MSENRRSLRLEEVDWSQLFPWLHLTKSLSMAVHPPKLMLSLLLVLLLCLGGWVLDSSLPGRSVYPGEVNQYAARSPESFAGWVADQPVALKGRLYAEMAMTARGETDFAKFANTRDAYRAVVHAVNADFQEEYDHLTARREADGKEAYRQRLEDLQDRRAGRMQSLQLLRTRGPFSAAVAAEISGFERLMRAAVTLNFGLGDLFSALPAQRESVLGALHTMLVTVPGWLGHEHQLFVVLYGLYALALWGVLGGGVARMTALDACRGEPGAPTAAVTLAVQSWRGYVMVWVLVPALVALIGLALVILGLLFNWWVTDLLAAVLTGLGLVMGACAAVLLAGWVLGLPLMLPALVVEASDGFDVISRCMSYVLAHPVRWLFYNALALFYGAVCYAIAAAGVFLTLWLTRFFLALGVYQATGLGVNRLDAILPAPRLGALSYNPDLWLLGPTGKAAAVVVEVWVYACVGLLAAFALNFFLSANTWIYLLLRRSADGTEMDQITLSLAPAQAGAAAAPAAGETGGDALEPAEGDAAASAPPAAGPEPGHPAP